MTKSILILFDIDGTILTSGGAGECALRTGFHKEFGIVEDLTQIEISGRTDSGIARQVLAKHGMEATEENLRRFFTGYLGQLQVELPARPGRLLPGVVPLLEALQNTPAVSLGLLTGNLERGAELKLRHYGVAEHFAFGAFADDHHDRNMLGEFAMARAAERHGVRFAPSSTYVIGDTPHDISCARAFGARAIAVATGSFSADQLAAHQPDALFSDLGDTPQVLRSLGIEPRAERGT
jgi:phosphoglycolate phosphatase-like HAD superfamily hydrolase